MTPLLEVDFLDPGLPATDVAARLCAYLDQARSSLDVAIYDFEARAGASATVADALERAAARGVAVRVAFNVDRPRGPAAPRPPRAAPDVIDGLDVPTRGVRGENTLMHHKYVVRDGADVWTGSLNWTNDAFSLEENVVLRVSSPALATAFAEDFERLWTHGNVESSGLDGPEVVEADVTIQPILAPRGHSLAQVVADRLARARHRIRVLSPVLTAGAILGTLAEIASRESFDISGAYDRTQMDEVEAEWQRVPHNRWKAEAWSVIAPRLSGKRSTPYAPGSPHDYMHAKAIVADGTVVAGSYNCSKHGVENAENVLVVRGGPWSASFVEYADRVAARYAGG